MVVIKLSEKISSEVGLWSDILSIQILISGQMVFTVFDLTLTKVLTPIYISTQIGSSLVGMSQVQRKMVTDQIKLGGLFFHICHGQPV